jgi:hypothetical protein
METLEKRVVGLHSTFGRVFPARSSGILHGRTPNSAGDIFSCGRRIEGVAADNHST